VPLRARLRLYDIEGVPDYLSSGDKGAANGLTYRAKQSRGFLPPAINF
jgi:hypothetical protein